MSNRFLQYSDIFFENEIFFNSPIFLAKKIDFLHDYAMIESDENGEERICAGARKIGEKLLHSTSFRDIRKHVLFLIQI